MVVIIITGYVCGRAGAVVMFLVSVEFAEGHWGRLRALAADAAGELNVLGHDGHALLV